MTSVCFKRLQKELVAIQKNPVENISTTPNENNLLEWHYVIEGPTGSVYEGGFYHGVLRFPKEYPYKPPSILMFTKNGRFKQNVRLCLSMSDYHPETWNPMWSVSSILSGLMSFMLDSQSTLGSIEASDEQRRQYARESLQENARNPVFRKLFPQYVKLAEERSKARPGRDRDSSIGALNQDNINDSEFVLAMDENHAENANDVPNPQPVQVQALHDNRGRWRKLAVAVGTMTVTAVAVIWGVVNNQSTVGQNSKQ